MEFSAFVLCCIIFSSISAFAIPDGIKELKNNSILPSIVQKYVEEYACKVEKPQCIETGGSCKSKPYGILCMCPSDTSAYVENLGCQVYESTCKQKIPQCLETGGSCTSQPSGILCICPSDTSYEEGSGCQKTCKNDNDCANGGKCITSDYGSLQFCHCLKGTYGRKCEKVEECKATDCGSEAMCTYNIDEKSAFCKCDVEELTFDDKDKKCKEICKDDSECANGGKCKISQEGSLQICHCLEGTYGPKCENVEECKTIDCGLDATCAYDIKEKAIFCKCNVGELTFDNKDKKCKEICKDDSECANGGECKVSQEGSLQICHCLEGTDGPKCENVEECKTIDCGLEATCAYDIKGKATFCKCNVGELTFDDKDKKCKQVCKDDNDCANGGECKVSKEGFLHTCHCLKGTDGPQCENVEECKTKDCGLEATCTYNIKEESTFCKCYVRDVTFDEKDKKCKLDDSTCKHIKKLCVETGGSCIPEPTGIVCICPSDMSYEYNLGCQVFPEMCDKYKPYCSETGGFCRSKANKGIVCECWDNGKYENNLGCKVPDDECEQKKIYCKETGGSCLFNRHQLVCVCPKDTYYSNEVGCIVPHVPRNLKAACLGNTSICLKWDDPHVLTVPILWYEIHWWNSTSKGWERSVSNNTSHTMNHLTPFVEYSFRVAAVTKTGVRKMSEKLDIRTAVGVPHAPRNLTVTMITNTTAELNWNEPLISTGPIITHRVCWQNSSSTGEEETQSAATFYTVRNLTPNVNYTFKVMALTEAGPGDWSRTVTSQTKLGDKCALVKCQNDGKCEIIGDEAKCRCTESYTGKYCETDLTSLDDSDDNIFISVFFKNRSLSADSKFDFHFSRKETSNRTITQLLLRLNSKSVVRPPDDKCSLISCQNGGACVVKYEKAVCICTDEYTGDYCEKSKCSLIQCQNGGKCQLKNGKVTCSCPDNYVGEYCENHKCSLIKCKNGGKCEIKNGNVGCVCPDSYTGDFCETDKCSLVPCKNGGKCDLINGKAICTCHDNFTGDLCETDKCSLIRCHNGGKCSIKNGKSVCVCNDEYIGDFCEIDKCSLIRCLNGGKCEIENKKAVCVCNKQFTGDNCEKRIH